MKVNFFTTLAAMEMLQDKESLEIKITRVGDEYAVLVAPKMNGKKADIVISGSPEDLDEGFMNEINKPIEKIKGLVSNAETAEIMDDDDLEEEPDGKEKKPVKSTKSTTKEKAASKHSNVSKKKPETEETSIEVKAEGNASEELAKKAAETEALKKEEEAKRIAENKFDFDVELSRGAEAFEKRLYEVAENHYRKATKLFPDDAAAKESYIKTKQYVDRLIDAGIYDEEKIAEIQKLRKEE